MKRGHTTPRPDPSPRRQSPPAAPESQAASHAALLHRLREIRLAVEGWQATSAARAAAPAPATDRTRSRARPAAAEDAAESARLAQEFQLRLLKTQQTLEEASLQLEGILTPQAHTDRSPAVAPACAASSRMTDRASTPMPTLPLKNPPKAQLPVRHASTQSERSPPPLPSKRPSLVSAATQSSPKPQIWESRSPCSLASQSSPAPAAWAIPAAAVHPSPIVAAAARPRDSPGPFESLYSDDRDVSVACEAHLVRPDDLSCGGCCEWCGRQVDAAEPPAEEAEPDETNLKHDHSSAESIERLDSSLWSASRGSSSTEASAASAPTAAETCLGGAAPRPATRSAALAALKLRRLSQLSA